MDIRSTQSLSTNGLYINRQYFNNPALEGVSLYWDAESETLQLTDINLKYNVALYSNFYKKAILTYNGYDKTSNLLLETKVYESNNTAPVDNADDSAKANFWNYKPKEFSYETEYLPTINPLEYSKQPYDYTNGFVVVKQFLTNESNYSMQAEYKALYRSPTLPVFAPANVSGTTVYTDGWYTSYIILTPSIAYARNKYNNNIPKGTIVYDPTSQSFYINISGTDTNLEIGDDTVNWSESITLEQWKDFLRNNIDNQLTNSIVLFTETQHLVMPELFRAIENVVLEGATACTKNYGLDIIDTWVRLSQKVSAAQIFFNNENFMPMQKVLESARALCSKCLTGKICKSC
jgi:hypothetical protein